HLALLRAVRARRRRHPQGRRRRTLRPRRRRRGAHRAGIARHHRQGHPGPRPRRGPRLTMAGDDDGAQPAAEGWRPVLAALANAEQRLLLAEVITAEARRHGTVIPDRRRAQGLARLAAAGLLSADDTSGDPAGGDQAGGDQAGGDPRWRVDAAGLRALLAAPAAGVRPSSGDAVVDRFVRDGRIHTYPAKPGPRRQLLRWAAQ